MTDSPATVGGSPLSLLILKFICHFSTHFWGFIVINLAARLISLISNSNLEMSLYTHHSKQLQKKNFRYRIYTLRISILYFLILREPIHFFSLVHFSELIINPSSGRALTPNSSILNIYLAQNFCRAFSNLTALGHQLSLVCLLIGKYLLPSSKSSRKIRA